MSQVALTESDINQLVIAELERRRADLASEIARRKATVTTANGHSALVRTRTRKSGAGAATGRTPMTEEGRARIAEAQRKRWAKKRREEAKAKKAATLVPTELATAEQPAA